MSVTFCYPHHGGQLTTTHSIFCYFSCVCFSTQFDEDGNKIFDDSHVGLSVLVENIFIIDENNDGTHHFDDDTKVRFDDKHMGLSVLIRSLIVIDEYKDNETFR